MERCRKPRPRDGQGIIEGGRAAHEAARAARAAEIRVELTRKRRDELARAGFWERRRIRSRIELEVKARLENEMPRPSPWALFARGG